MIKFKLTMVLIFVDAWDIKMKLTFLFLSFFLNACSPIFSEIDCSENIYQEIKSKNDLTILNITKRDCGATTAVVTNVYVKSQTDKNNKNWGDKIYSIQSESDIDISILLDSIIINSPKNASNVFLSLDQWRGLKILYK